MNLEELTSDAVFQLNLLIWMAKEQPAEPDQYYVNPFFHLNGFEWLMVAQPFNFPLETLSAIKAASGEGGLTVTMKPEPELVLKRDKDQTALYFEAKKTSFGSDSTAANQARGHLLATGPAFAEVQTPLKIATLTYVLPEKHRALMEECLAELTTQLREARFQPGPHSVCGLSVEGGTLFYHLDDQARGATGTHETNVALISDLDEDTDPSPLLLVYSDKDCPNVERSGYYRRILIAQVLATLLCELHRVPAGTAYTIPAATILMSTTQGVFEYLGPESRKAMEILVKENVFLHIQKKWKEDLPGMVVVTGRALSLSFPDAATKDKFLDWLESRKTKFPEDAPLDDQWEQIEMFPA